MKKLIRAFSLFLTTSLIPLSLSAQSYIKPVGEALIKATAKDAAQVSAKDILVPAITKNTAKLSVTVPGIGLDPKVTTPLGVPYLTPTVKILDVEKAGLSSLKANIHQSVTQVESHQNYAEKVLGEQVFNELTAFVDAQHRFPEQHLDEDLKDLSSEEALALFQESALRSHIDLLLDAAPENPWSKKVLALQNELNEKLLEDLSLPFLENDNLARQFQTDIFTQFTRPFALESEELPNAYQLTENFYRGAQPTEQGYKMLADRGVKTIISFRTHKPNKQLIESLGMESVHIPLNPALITPAQMIRFLEIVSDPEHQPVYVHCRHGSDRTGTMVAMYRMVIQKWSRKQALAEMKDPRFGYHKIFFTLPSHIKMVNTTKLSGKLQK